MKNKKILRVFLVFILIALSLVSVSFYSKINENKYDKERTIEYLKTDQITYLYYLISQNDESYNFIEYSDEINPLKVNKAEEMIQDLVEYYFNYITNDPNIFYSIQKDSSIITEKTDDMNYNPNNSLIYSHVIFNKDGSIECEGDFCTAYEETTIYDILENLNLTLVQYVETGNRNFAFFDETSIDISLMSLKPPVGYEIYFMIPKGIIPNGRISSILLNYDFITICAISFVLISLIVLSIIFLLMPIKTLETINPYKFIHKTYLEINLILWGILILISCFASYLLMRTTIDESLLYGLYHFSINLPNEILYIINGISWFITYFLLTCIIFIIKNWFSHGFITYLKENTLISCILKKFKSLMNDVLSSHLSLKMMIPIIGFVIINGIIICFIKLMSSGYAFFTILVYSAFLLTLSILIINKIYQHYLLLLDKTKELSHGNFDLQINEDMGIFENYKKELEHVKDGFEKAVQEEVKATNMKTELITNVSHDLKTPITCIKNYVTLLEDESLDDNKRKEYISNLHQYTNRLTRLVEDLFEVSKVTSGNVSLELVELDIIDLIKQILAENDDLLAKQHLQLITKFSSEHILVKLDSNKTYRIFENLFVNLSKYAMPSSRVFIDIYDNEQFVHVDIKNISKDIMNFSGDEITERFVRGDTSRHENGSGLGLAIVKSYSDLQHIDFKVTIDGDLFKTSLKFKKG
ncbi:MAG: sensor histidine kinase [Traorella sp.]